MKKKKNIIRSIELEAYSHLSSLRLPLILIQVVFMAGTLGYYYIDDFTVINAIYQTGITFTTVGFGEIQPISDIGKLFTITLIVLGFASFSLAIAVVVETVNNKVFFKLLREVRMLYKIEKLYNHYVIYYYNEYTESLLDQLKAKQIPFVIVDPDPNFEQIALDKKYPYYVISEPHTEESHLKSFLSSAKGIITLSKQTSNNIAQIASVRLYEKELNRDPYFIMSYASDDSDVKKLINLGSNNVFSPANLLAKKVSSMLLNPLEALSHSFLDDLFFNNNKSLSIREYKVKTENWIRFKKIKSIRLRATVNVSIIGMKRQDGKIIHMPRGNDLLQTGATLLLIGTEINIKKSISILSASNMPSNLVYD